MAYCKLIRKFHENQNKVFHEFNQNGSWSAIRGPLIRTLALFKETHIQWH